MEPSGIKQSLIVIGISLILIVIVAMNFLAEGGSIRINPSFDTLMYKNNDGMFNRYARSFGYIGFSIGLTMLVVYALGFDKEKKKL